MCVFFSSLLLLYLFVVGLRGPQKCLCVLSEEEKTQKKEKRKRGKKQKENISQHRVRAASFFSVCRFFFPSMLEHIAAYGPIAFFSVP